MVRRRLSPTPEVCAVYFWHADLVPGTCARQACGATPSRSGGELLCRRLTRSHELQRRRGSVLQLPDLDVEPCEATLAQSSPKGGLYAIRTDSVGTLVLAQHLGAGRQRHPSALDGFLSAQTVCKRRGPGRMKHIELRTHAIQDWVVSGRLNRNQVSTHWNAKALLTKASRRRGCFAWLVWWQFR